MSIFTKVSVQKVRHNTFDLSHERKFSGGVGRLIPCFLAEALPNDNFNINTSQLVRFAPMVAPVMHKFSVYTHFFFVPNRILWDNWQDFINGGQDGTVEPVFPFLAMDDVAFDKNEGGLPDYLGIPIDMDLTTAQENVSAIPFAAYMRVWYEFYRDQNLYTGAPWDDAALSLLDGDNTTRVSLLTNLRYRAWQHDYFTSALPWTQRGAEATIPLGTDAPIEWNLQASPPNADIVRDANTGANMTTAGNVAFTVTSGRLTDGTTALNLDNSGSLTADLSQATAASINDLRRAFRLQEWLELNARGGARYNETIKIHFGISPGDARLQRPEFLGGSATPLVISEVLQTSETLSTPNTPQGNMAGHGVSIGGKSITNYKCKEHGYIIGIMSVMPKSAYQQGLAKHWFKFDKFDYYWRSFANIGEQPILNKEIFMNSADTNRNETWGYIPRYAEYKYMNDSVHGAFRSTLDHWHAGRIFATRPNLNSTFISCLPTEINRIFAVPDLVDEQFYVQMHHRVKARRPMPYFGQPTI